MTIRRLGRCPRELWEEVAHACPYATYFHTPAWAELMGGVHPQLEPVAESFRLDDGVVAVLPSLSHRLRRVFRGYQSMVPGVYGGPIAARPLTPEEVDAVLGLFGGVATAGLRVFGNPYLEAFAAPADSAEEFTQVIDLREGFESVFARFQRKNRQSVRYGREAGVRVRRAETLEDHRAYYEVYRVARRRWGAHARSDDSFDLFAEIHRRADPDVDLWLALQEDKVVAGALWLHWNGRYVGWHNATDPQFLKLQVMNVLLAENIRHACERGVRWCDLNPSAKIPGVIAFKDSFGAERLYFRHARRAGGRAYRWSRRLEKLLRSGRRAING